MLDMRSNDDAEGERRIIGSRRRELEGFFRFDTRAEFVERDDVVGATFLLRFLPR
jgi:hypothetical protein